MDINKLKEKLQSFENKNSKGTNVERKNLFWRPSVGKETIRVVPSKFNKDNPFMEVYFHYGIGNKTIMSPINWQEKDPISEFADNLRKTKQREDWLLAKKLDPKMRIFIPVVVRGKEDEGVKLWSFGKKMYMSFLQLADNEDIGDFTDIITGKDIIVTTLGKEATGTDYNESTIMPRMKETPLTTDKALLKKLLDEQTHPLDAFTKYSYDEIAQMLQDHLVTSEESDDENAEEEAQSKPSKSRNFEKLFENDK